MAGAGRYPAHHELDEASFLASTAEAAGCGLAVDLGALSRSAALDGLAATELLTRLPRELVRALVLQRSAGTEAPDLLAAAAHRFPSVPVVAEHAGLAAWPEPLVAPRDAPA